VADNSVLSSASARPSGASKAGAATYVRGLDDDVGIAVLHHVGRRATARPREVPCRPSRPLQNPSYVALDADALYWLDELSSGVFMASK